MQRITAMRDMAVRREGPRVCYASHAAAEGHGNDLQSDRAAGSRDSVAFLRLEGASRRPVPRHVRSAKP